LIIAGGMRTADLPLPNKKPPEGGLLR
jgi:hypothetical protein